MIISVIGLMFGDEGKGHVVAALTKKYESTANVRFSGGSQAAHRVVINGIAHVFAQFCSGSAVSETVKTYLSSQMAIDPLNLLKEAEVHEKNGIKNLLCRLVIDPNCPVITPAHKYLNQIRELRRKNKISTTGLGVGEVFADIKNGKVVLTAKDLLNENNLREKLFIINKEKLEEINILWEDRTPTDFYMAKPLVVFSEYLLCGKLLGRNICEDFKERLSDELKHTVIFEGSQGTLLDNDMGFKPHVTKSNVSLLEADRLISILGYKGERLNIGVIRAYLTRHGLGYFPSEDEILTELLPDSHNKFNQWQGIFRCGWFDLDLLKYSLKCNIHIDKLIVTNVDRLPEKVFVYYDNKKHSISKINLLTEIEKILPILCISSSEKIEDFKF